MEELEEKDVRLYGVDGILERRANNHIQVMASELDTAFFAEAAEAGTTLTLTKTAANEQAEEAIQTIENTKNKFVDGVPRSMISIVCSTAFYGEIRNYLDTTAVANITTDAEEFVAFHGAKAYSTVHLPDDVKFVVIVDGAVAQPVMSNPYVAEKIPLSNAWGVEMFYSYGTKAVMPELIGVVK